MQVLKKASLEQMEELHGVVASSLKQVLLNDPTDVKNLALAMKFLKDNEVIVDKFEVAPQQNLLAKITQLTDNSSNKKLLEVDMLLENYL